MKTTKYFDEYKEYVTHQKESINNMENERDELTQKIKDDKKRYKELIANSKDTEADKLYNTFDKNEMKLKALEKRLEIKREAFKENQRNKVIELIKYQKELPELYKKDKETLLKKFEPIINEFNKLIDEVWELNKKYEDEYSKFSHLYNKEKLYNDKAAKDELKHYYREYSANDLINAYEIPNQQHKKIAFKKGV